MATEEKKGPSDGGYDEDEKKRGLEKDEKFKKEMEDLESVSEEMKERKKEKLKQFKKREVKSRKQKEEEETKIGGQVTKKKIYEHKKGVGVFIGNKTNPQKIRKALNKIHGLSSGEKKMFSDVVAAYSPTKTVLKKDKLKKLFRELKHIKSGRRGGTDFKRLKETFDKDFLRKNFGNKRKVAKIERKFFGKEDPLKHKVKPSSNRNPGAGKPGSTSPTRVGKKF